MHSVGNAISVILSQNFPCKKLAKSKKSSWILTHIKPSHNHTLVVNHTFECGQNGMLGQFSASEPNQTCTYFTQ